MIVNYDKENGKIFLGLKKTIPQISNNVDTLFKNVGKSEKFSDLLQKFYVASNFKNDPFKNWVDGLDSTTKSAMTAGDALDSYNKHLQETAKSTSKLSTITSAAKGAIGTIASSALNIGAGMLIANGINYAISVWDKYANAQEHAIEAGEEASNKIKENYDKINNAKQWKSTNLERFTELAKGVNASGYNVSLSTAEFSEYQSLASSLADTLPGLVAGFNDLGQPIIKTATNVEQLNQAFRKNDVKQYRANIKEAQKVIDAFQTQYNEEGSLFKEAGAKQKQAVYRNILDIYEKYGKVTKPGDKNIWQEQLLLSNLNSADPYSSFAFNDALKSLDIENSVSDIIKNIDKISDEYEKGQTELEQYASSVKETLPSFFMISDEYAKLAEKSPVIDTFIQSITSGLGSDYVNENFPNPESVEKWASSITSALGNKNVQTSIEDLFQLEQDKAKTPFKKYEKDVNSLVDAISGSIPEITSDMMKASLGIDRELTNMATHYTKVSDEVGKEFADNLSISDLELASDIISEKDIKNAEELKQAIIEARNASQSIEANPIFDSINVAKETRNKGDDYLDAHNYVKEAKEMYDKGLTGTDEFKATAKYLSPTGAEDATNFIENYSKATRYLTEDSSGVKNFLTDLSKKTDEAGNALASFDKETGKWSYNITDLSKAAHDMGMGFEFFMDMFGRLEDYNFSNNFFSTEEEGVEKLTDKTIKLAKAKRELAELEAKGENQTAINAKKEEIAVLEKDQQQIRSNLKQVAKQSAERINEQITASKDAYVALKEERDKIIANPELFGENTEEVVAKMDEELKSLAQQGMFEIDGEMNIVNKDKVKEEIESEPVEINVEGNFEELKEQAKESVDVVQKLVEDNNQGVPIKINLDSNSVFDIDTQIAGVMSYLDKLRNENGTINIEAEGAQDAINVLVALIARKQELNEPVIMTADTSNVDASVSSVIGKLQEFQNAYNELERLNQLKSAGVDVDTSAAQEKLDGLASEISNFDGKQAEIIATLGIDPSSSETISASIQSITPEILAKVDPTLVDKYVAEEKKGKGTVEWDNEDSKVRAYASVPKTADGTVTWDNDTTNVKKTFTAQGTITWGNTTSLFGGVASGTMLSPAHADGTAYNVLNTVPAYANGKVSLSQNEKALVNEVGVESLIRDGKWMLIPGGAHIENLKKGDIILNASQTSDLLKSGKTAGHGKAYANGTVPNVRSLVSNPLSAYAGGSGGGSFQGGAATGADKKKPSSSSNKKSSKKKSSNSSSSSDKAKEFEEVLDWIEIKIDRIERKIKNLERVAGSAFETYTDRSKALAEQMGEVSNEITVQQQAYERYLQQANSISLSDDYKTQVQNGTIDISTITDEDLKKNIDEYQQW